MDYKNAKIMFDKINIELSDEQFEKFLLYEKELLDWNEKINLTTITEDEDVWIKHFIDSCTIAEYIEEDCRIIDVGTGAGFPGVPVKIIKPSTKLTLLDSLNKRINFLKDVCEKIKLEDVDCLHGRAEELARDEKYREKYDIATARAVANLATLAEYCLPFVKKGGLFICMKSGNVDGEIKNAQKAIKTLGGKIEEIKKFDLIGLDISRSIIIIRKIDNTPKQYPRKAGKPLKEPIK